MLLRTRTLIGASTLALLTSACGGATDDTSATDPDATPTAETDATETTDDETTDDETTDETGGDLAGEALGADVDLTRFVDGALAEDASKEPCTLSGGAAATCLRITVAGFPASHEVGPFCPETIEDDASAGGIWFDGNGVYDLDGDFILNLPELYDDDAWQLYDDDGNVNTTETAEEFEAAARPDVDPSLQNHCVEGQLAWLEDGEPVTSTVLIPVTPVAADAASLPGGNQGITLDGVVIAASAPVEAILGAYTIAAFDDCGGHFNPVEGYHLHGQTGCSEVGEAAAGDTPAFGYAMDGVPLHSPIDGVELGECNSHTTEADGFHYHANDASQNQVVACLLGQTEASAAGGRGGPPGGGPPPQG